MSCKPPRRSAHLGLPLALAGALSLLAACGGSEPSRFDGLSEPLFDPSGQPAAAAQVPPPAFAPRPTAALYASAAQLEWQQLVSAPTTVLVDLDELGSVDAALAQAQQVQAFHGGAGLAWFVSRGSDAQAASVADALAARGVAPVFLVR